VLARSLSQDSRQADGLRSFRARSLVHVTGGRAALREMRLQAREVFGRCAHLGRVGISVVIVKPLPSQGRREIRPLTAGEVKAIADAIDPRFAAPVIFAALGSGLRAGELWALRVGQVDFLRRSARISESIDDRGAAITTKLPKTGKARSLRLDEASVEVLARHLESFPSDDYVFTAAEGGPVRHRNFVRRHFSPAVVACGLPTGVRFHDPRHTHASLLIADGWRADQVKDRLGHGSIRTTLDTYAHLFDHDDEEQLVALSGKIRAAMS
jgi:integrase